MQRKKFEDNILPWGWATDDHLQGSACPLRRCRWQSAEPWSQGRAAAAEHMSRLFLARGAPPKDAPKDASGAVFFQMLEMLEKTPTISSELINETHVLTTVFYDLQIFQQEEA